MTTMLDQLAKPFTDDFGIPVEQALATNAEHLQQWSERLSDASHPMLATIPDIAASCELLLADSLLHALSAREREGLLRLIRVSQNGDGSWSDATGRPDLSLTVLGTWALRLAGDDPRSESLSRARRCVLEMGGAQRASFAVRLWLAMAGAIPWSWLPAIPSEIWFLPASIPLSAQRLSAWARAMVTAYHLLASVSARLQLGDPSDLLLQGKDGDAIPPRLTRAGLAGDVLQAFDQAIKLSRKLPRAAVHRASTQRALAWVEDAQQAHGGWFSVRPTILTIIALRAHGRRSDDPRIQRALAYLKAARGYVESPDGLVLCQGLSKTPLALEFRFARALQRDALDLVLAEELQDTGPWQRRAEAPPGGWPAERGAQQHLDLWSTCEALDLLGRAQGNASTNASLWAARRRAGEVILAMQELDGSFARFERGEGQVPLARLPWNDADRLAMHPPNEHFRVRLGARALTALSDLGWQASDDRLERGLANLEQSFGRDGASWEVGTLAVVTIAATRLLPADASLRRALEQRLRSRQREDGSFGDLGSTARALRALLAIARIGDGNKASDVCIQARRAAQDLFMRIQQRRHCEPSRRASPGLGLSRCAIDPIADARELQLALQDLRASMR